MIEPDEALQEALLGMAGGGVGRLMRSLVETGRGTIANGFHPR